MKFSDIRVRLLAADLAFAAYWMRTDMKVVLSPKPKDVSPDYPEFYQRRKKGAG